MQSEQPQINNWMMLFMLMGISMFLVGVSFSMASNFRLPQIDQSVTDSIVTPEQPQPTPPSQITDPTPEDRPTFADILVDEEDRSPRVVSQATNPEPRVLGSSIPPNIPDTAIFFEGEANVFIGIGLLILGLGAIRIRRNYLQEKYYHQY